MPAVSVIVPVYNTAAFLDRCLLSIVGQSFKDFDIICVDDCSTDASAKMVAAAASKDRRIKLIRHDQNKGAGGARNTAIKASSSRYIAFIDSDDYVDNDLLRDAYAATENEKFDVVAYGYRSIDSEGKFVSRAVPKRQKFPDASKLKGKLLITEPHPTNKLWRRSLFVDHGIWFPEKAYWEDFATVPRLMYKAKSIAMIDKPLYSYYDRQDSTVNTVTDRHVMDFFRTLDTLKDFMIAEKIYAEEKHDFDEIIRIVLGWYAGRIAASKTMAPQDAARNIRYLALLAGSYISADDSLRANTSFENVEMIKRFTRHVQEAKQARESKGLLRSFRNRFAAAPRSAVPDGSE